MKTFVVSSHFQQKNREDREGMMPDAEEWYRELCAEYGVLTERQVAALAPRNHSEPSRKSVSGLGFDGCLHLKRW